MIEIEWKGAANSNWYKMTPSIPNRRQKEYFLIYQDATLNVEVRKKLSTIQV